jgi:3-dehydroquinate synthase
VKKLLVRASKTYPVYVGENLMSKVPIFLKKFTAKTAFVISDKKLVGTRKLLMSSLKKSGWKVSEIPVRSGESLKSFEAIYPIYSRLLNLGAKRDSVLIALGGGSVGDAAGFVAATYLRGIPWVGVPTTLLAMVDSGVGGKTGINHPMGKNLIGAFHQPDLVLCDISTLKTLSNREIISGLGEALKYGLIYERAFFDFLKKNWADAINFKPGVLQKIIYKSLAFKARAVSIDEKDLRGVREFLNFGHTFGHGLEAVSQYKKFQHGEAVIWGMRFASALSLLRGKIQEREFFQIDSFLRTIPLPRIGSLSQRAVFNAMKFDKKMRHGKINFVLLKKIGSAIRDSGVTKEDLKRAWFLIGESK